MNYKETVEYLFAKLPMYSRIGPDAFKKNLTNTLILCEHLNNPQNKFKSIHIAGTNGKGSVSHMLAAILQTAGYKTGLFTSPHLKDFRERVKVNGTMMPEEYVIDFVAIIKPLIEEIKPSFFEITVAMAFDYFAKQPVDIAIIEVGLGGRLDSTNVITPELSVITNIGWDHMNMLGNTLKKIAFEKAGIIKKNIPVVVGESSPETLPVFKTIAKEKDAAFFEAENHRYVADWKWENQQLSVSVEKHHATDRMVYQLDLPGIYQLKNLITVLEVVSALRQTGWNINEEDIHKALRQVKKLTGLHGRWELIHQHPDVVLEVAHNEDGIRKVIEHLELTSYSHLHFIIGIAKDKEVEKILSLLPKHAAYYFTQAQMPRALNVEDLKQKAENFGLKGNSFSEVNEALKNAISNASKNDLILVCGSIFLIGEVDQSQI